MNDIFAKLYEKEGKQLLVTKEMDDDDCPAIAFRTTTKSGHTMTLKASFKKDDCDLRDESFNNVNEDNAWGMIVGAPGMKI